MTARAQTIEQFHEELAAKTPTPGGGAAAAITGATAAATAAMVVAHSFTKRLADHKTALQSAQSRLHNAAALFHTLADEDAAAYAALAAAFKPPRNPDVLRPAALAATQVPLAVMAAAADVLRLLASLPPITNRNLRSDLAIAAILADAACRASRHTVEINIPTLAELNADGGVREQADAIARDAAQLARRVEDECA